MSYKSYKCQKNNAKKIWKLATTSNHGRCSFDEFTSIMKLSHLAQSRIPLYIINVSKLIFYHPPLASTEFFEFSEIFSDLQKQQVLQNMVGFYNLPSTILDSDDRLMELEKKALRPYHPIHFEINAKVLIATFSNTISDQSIQDLHRETTKVLKDHMGFHEKRHAAILEKVYVQRPSPKELGMTPAGPPPNEQPNNGNNMQPNNNKPHPQISNAGTYNVNRNKYNNGNHPHPQPQPQHAHSAMNVYGNNNNNNHPHQHNMYNSNNNNDYNQPPMNDRINIQEMQQILLADEFWEEFRMRSEIDKIIMSSDDKIRTRQAMQLISKLRNISLKSVKFTDEGVKLIANKTKYELRDQFMNKGYESIHLKATILGLSDVDIPQQHQQQQSYRNRNQQGITIEEVYKGIVIEGLPEVITNDDENIRKLDSAVLNEFIVSHIEVVDNVLRITFANEVTHKNINQLRKYLKGFLKDDIKLDKKSMKNVSIIPCC